jgi:hypothetical protein
MVGCRDAAVHLCFSPKMTPSRIQPRVGAASFDTREARLRSKTKARARDERGRQLGRPYFALADALTALSMARNA